MANQATVTSIARSVRRRLNLVSMNTISDTELKEFVRDSLAQFYEIMVSAWRDYYVGRVVYTLEANREAYALPDDFRAESSVYITTTSNGSPARRYELDRFNTNQWNNYPLGFFNQNPWPVMFRCMGEQILFTPVASATTGVVELIYVPQWEAPISDDVTISRTMPNGWELWVIFDVCVSLAVRLRMPELVQMLQMEREKNEKRVRAAMSIRGETAPVMMNQFDQQGGMFWGGGGSP